MLSRVAGRIYWMARYIERAENTARLVNTYNFLLLDLPRGARVDLQLLPVIVGESGLYTENYQRHDERNTVKFMLADGFNSGSLVNSIAHARENCRTSREVLPGQAWEQLNELKLYADTHVKDALSRRGRYAFLTEIIHRCQQLAGLLAGTMTHDHAYEFVRIGRNLERADMTTRVIDIGALSQEGTEEYGGIDVHVWTSMLRAMNAYQMYRKDVQLGVQREAVVKYLLQNNYFPRSFAHCLNQVEESICNLPHQRTPLKSVRDVHRRVDRIKPKNLDAYMLHAEVDRLQAELNTVHDEIGKTWFV